MAEFQASQDSVVEMLTCMEPQITKLEQVDLETHDEEHVEEKD